VFADLDSADLTGVSVQLRFAVTKEVPGQDPQQVFLGTMELTGGADRNVAATHEGGFPTAGIFTTDLSSVDSQLGVFRVFVFPNLAIDYPYDVVVGEPFALRATVSVAAQNMPGGIGVAAVIGTPFDSLNQVITLTQGTQTAAKLVNAMKQERAQPTGQAAFETATPLPSFLRLLSCGALGFESVVGGLALMGLRIWNPYRRGAAGVCRATPFPRGEGPAEGQDRP
jgi:hypothetical protein